MENSATRTKIVTADDAMLVAILVPLGYVGRSLAMVNIAMKVLIVYLTTVVIAFGLAFIGRVLAIQMSGLMQLPTSRHLLKCMGERVMTLSFRILLCLVSRF